jgi:RNA polymerase sigma-70 factor (ECF subfamily)
MDMGADSAATAQPADEPFPGHWRQQQETSAVGPPTAVPTRLQQRQNDPQKTLQPSLHLEFEIFYRSFVKNLVGFLIWQGARLADAAEIAQETLQRAFRSWPTIDHPEAWCRRVASREYARRIATVNETPGRELAGGPLLPASPSQTSAWEERQEVLRLLALLPWRQRQVMAWTFDGYEPTEIADELGISAEAVRSNLYKARKTLAEYLRCERETLT